MYSALVLLEEEFRTPALRRKAKGRYADTRGVSANTNYFFM
jgi:hypothetical protein